MITANDNRRTPIQVSSMPTAAQRTIRALRFWIMGWRCQDARYLDRARLEFSPRAKTQSAKVATCAFAYLFEVLRANAQKEFQHCPPCHPYASDDETNFVYLTAAAQAGLWRDVSDLAEQFVHASAVGDIITRTQIFAKALVQNDMHIPFERLTSHVPELDIQLEKTAAARTRGASVTRP